ncbi:MAG: M28 family peptidase [Bacteroidales bacterium]|nr:M28 family peptidase [Bacteroidales bacterium]
MKRLSHLLAICALSLATGFFLGCKNGQPEPTAESTTNYASAQTPAFSADSAYQFVARQVAFGYRAPGLKGHDACAAYLFDAMRRFCDTVVLQHFNATLWDGSRAKGTNIIASINPQSEKRILLCAHWDSRLWADHDPDEANHRTPLLGANDGASGVGILMEMARVMKQMPPSAGIDFIFFDLEDQGIPEWAKSYEDNTWCLGSQYWAKNKHLPYYRAVYGILLDMVGTDKPRFTKEEVSRRYASGITDKLWRTASALGYGNVFVDQNTDPILDDHMYVNQIAGIPMTDIVQNSPESSFFPHWHTIGDSLAVINKETLALVANVVMKTIYGDYPAECQ